MSVRYGSRRSPTVRIARRHLGFVHSLGGRQLAGWRRIYIAGFLVVVVVAGGSPGIDGTVQVASAGPVTTGVSVSSANRALVAGDEASDGSDGDWSPPASGVSTCVTGAGSFSDDFTQDTTLSRDCWSRSGAVLGEVAARLDASFECPQLVFDSGMKMTSGGTGRPEFSGIQSTYSYSGPFDFETTVSGLESGDDAFSVYLVGPGSTSVIGVEGDLAPGNGADYGLWDSQGSIPAGTGLPDSEDLIPAPVAGTNYIISISVNSAGTSSVQVNGVASAVHADVGTGPFYVVLGQRDTSGANTGTSNTGTSNTGTSNTGTSNTGALNTALWSSASLGGVTETSFSAGAATVAGVETVPASVVPAASLGGSPQPGSGDTASAPLSSIALAASPLSSIPLSSIPLSSIELPGPGDTAVAAAQETLSSTLLSELSVTYPAGCGASPSPPCTGWQGILAGTPYASTPLESVTLAEVLSNPSALANLGSLDLGALDLSSSPLSSIPLSSIPLSSIPLSSIPLPGAASGTSGALTAWCTELQSLGFSCASFGINDSATSPDDNGVTLLTLALAGVPLSSIPLSSIPLSSIPLSSIDLAGSPLSSIPLSSITLASNPLSSIPLSSINLTSSPLSSIPLSSIPLSSIPLSSIPLSSISDLPAVVDCSTYTLCATATLGQAAAAGALLAGADLGDLGTYNGTTLGQLGTYNGITLGELLEEVNTSAPGFPSITLGDVLLSMLPPASYPWQSVSLSALPLAADETSGGTVTYTAVLTATASSVQQVSVSLPATFAYVPGSTRLDGNAAPDPSAGSSLNWSLSMTAGAHVLQFEANAGIGLGPVETTLSVNGQASSTASVEVVDGEAPAIESQATAVPLTAGDPPLSNGDLNIGYLTSPGDLNDWSVPVAQGEELSLALTNLPATYDLELFGPSPAQLQGTPAQDLPGVTDTLPSLSPQATTEATPGSQDLPVTPPAGDSLLALSNNSNGQDQYIQTPPLAAGTYLVQVSGYDGAFSSAPYLLRANLLGGATSPSCPPIVYPGPMPPAASGPVSLPSGVNTLFLVDTQRLDAAFGTAAEATIMSDLQAVASDSAAGVTGAIVPVDSYANVQSAYGAWDANPCSVGNANDVVAAIAAVVDQIRADNPTLQNLVIVGADDQVPFARLADGAIQSNERDYGASTFAGENNVEADALSLGYYFSDDPYASPQPLGVGSATLYTPELAVGRLVESAAQIESALTRFVSSQGDLDSTAGLTTGYSFLTSGADAVSADLAADGLTPEALINEDWSRSDLVGALTQSPTPGVDSVNAHFDYSRLLPADDNASGQDTDLFTTTDIRDSLSSYAGRLLFSMGCHSGLDIDDAEVAASGVATPVDDWAKAFADAGALWVGNTGYGYADTDTIAYSARLMADFAADLAGPLSIGEALTEAKQQYAAGNAVLSPYDLKALMESTFFGLPMYKLNQGGTATSGTGTSGTGTSGTGTSGTGTLPTAEVDQATGLTDLSTPIDVNLGLGTGPGQLGLVSTANGDYYQVNGTAPYSASTQTTEYRPVEPLVSTAVTEPGLVPHGALVTALSSSDVADPTPLYSMPSAGSAGATPPEIGYAAFPGTLQRVASYGSFSASGTGEEAQLDLVAGQFIPNTSSPGAGTERLFNSMSAQVYYLPPTSPDAQDFTPPTIDYTEASDPAATLNFEVQVIPSVAPVQEVLVLYTDAVTPGTWQVVNLSSSNGQTWTGSGAPTASGQVQYIVEALDAAGNVAVSNNEGTAFNASGQAGIGIALSGNGPVDGFYTGTVTATVTAPAGSTYVLDGAAATAVPPDGVISITSSGEHTLTVTDPAGETVTQAFAISMYQTTTTPSVSTSAVVVGQSVTVTASVSPASAGVGTPTGNVEFFDGASPIAACGGAGGIPLSSVGQAVCTISYAATGTHQITAHYLGGPNFAASTSSAAGLTVDPRTATVSAFQVSGSPSTFGAENGLVFSVTVTPGDDDPFPNGDTVTVSVGTTTLCTITLVPSAAVSGSGNSASGSCSPSSATALPAGNYADVAATFNKAGADPDFQVSAPATLELVVDEAKSVTPAPPPPTTSPLTTPVTSPSPAVAISWASPAPISFGTKLTSAQLDATASVPGVFRYSPSLGAVLQPGTQTLRVTFTPTGLPYAVATTSTTTISVGFTGKCIETTHRGSLIVSKGDAVCVRPGAKISGDVSVASGGALFMSGGTISGALRSSGALAVTLCGTTITGPVSVGSTSGPVTIGGPGCAGDTFGAAAASHPSQHNASQPNAGQHNAGQRNAIQERLSHRRAGTGGAADGPALAHQASTGRTASAPAKSRLTISGNAGGVYIRNSRVTGPTVVSANLGGITISGNTLTVSTSVTRNKGGCAFTNNKVSGPLVITGNTGGFKFSGNTLHGPITRSANS